MQPSLLPVRRFIRVRRFSLVLFLVRISVSCLSIRLLVCAYACPSLCLTVGQPVSLQNPSHWASTCCFLRVGPIDKRTTDRRTNTCRLVTVLPFCVSQVYQSVILKERKGEYLGKTVQVVPHIMDEIQVRSRASPFGRSHKQ